MINAQAIKCKSGTNIDGVYCAARPDVHRRQSQSSKLRFRCCMTISHHSNVSLSCHGQAAAWTP